MVGRPGERIMSGTPGTVVAIDPDRLQRQASDPAASVWVGASAGSGKTKVLTDRVLRLLLSGTPPQRLLCLTFTKAAAAEMANRVNRGLSTWATASDGDLQQKIADLAGDRPEAGTLETARRLFARVLDVPGGLKIQTIHSFCESLLGRFPIEAGIPPHFQVMDERSAAELMLAARDRVLASAVRDPSSQQALQTLTGHLHEDRFADLLRVLLMHRGRLRDVIGDGTEIDAAVAAVYDRLDVEPGLRIEEVIARACQDDAFDAAAVARAAEALRGGSEKTDQPRGEAVQRWIEADVADRAASFASYVDQFLTREEVPRKRLVTKAVAEKNLGVADALSAEAVRLAAVCQMRRAVVTAEATAALLSLGGAILHAFEQAKELRVELDYDDLIYKARDLLRTDSSGFAGWVLFKLDGGLDHILIDEAQDTNPEQWQVVAALADEFFAGLGAREEERTIFAVGDVKQSIFSFQRADPKAFRDYREHFGSRAEDVAKQWRSVDLDISFRSAEPVLRAVDGVFAQPAAASGVIDGGDTLSHRPFRGGQAGLVELWPPVGPVEMEETEWQPPVRRRELLAPDERLAQLIAAKLQAWIGTEYLPSHDRTVRAGDIMVLLRRRSGFMEALVRALKKVDVPVAGVDRMALTEQLAVMDLMALARFLLLPDDDLTLAVVLKGPFIGLDDDDLFRLCHDRGASTLWRRLSGMASENVKFAQAQRWLAALLGKADFAPPFELLAGVLAGPAALPDRSGWQCLLERLGPEAEDPVDEFMAQALAYERTHPPSLQGFLHWLDAGSTEIKRDLEQSDRDEVRVMTVHGAKGLQAPIVIMPDTMAMPRMGEEVLWSDGVPLWPPNRAYQTEECQVLRDTARTRSEEEYRRLLYVAMTRAEDRLYVCGWHGRQKPSDGCWYSLIEAGLAGLAEPAEMDFSSDIGDAGWSGDGLRIASDQTAVADARDERTVSQVVTPSVEDWMQRPPPDEPAPPRPLAPSRPSAADPPTLSPIGGPSENRFKRGLIVHRLLQLLPDLPADDRRAACVAFLARPGHALAMDEQQELADEVMAILEMPEFAELFGPASRAEVPLIGTIAGPDGPEVIAGQVDRLLVLPDEIVVLDYKTSRPPPDLQENVAPAYLRQMAAYRAVLAEIWPNRPIRCGLLWTAVPRLMTLDDSLLDRVRVAT
jgi:ATP-dependent helicase/nuclease subunit A